MKYYHDLYLKCDILLLAVLEKFRNNGLCLSHNLSATDLSWDIMLNMTKVELELTPDPDKFIFFEKGMRGEVSYIS